MKSICGQLRTGAMLIAVLLLSMTALTAVAQSTGSDLPPGMIARQGGAMVSLQDIDAYAQKIPEKDRAGFFDSPQRIQGVIMNMLLQRQLAAEARAAKLEQNPDVQIQIQQAVDDALARVAVQHYRESLKLPDFAQLAQEYFATHKDEFLIHGAVDVKHVLVSTKDRSDADAKTRIGEVEATAKAHRDQFDALVEKYSDDPSKKDNHGLIENGGSANMAAPFAQAANALKTVGEVSPITKTEYGYHVLMLVGRKPDKQMTYAEVRDGLMLRLRKDYVERQTTDHTNQLRNNVLDANPDLVASLRTRFLPPGVVLPEDAQAAADEAKKNKAAQAGKPAH
jgi:parvulin-like peptidyl-prolyl isomerase